MTASWWEVRGGGTEQKGKKTHGQECGDYRVGGGSIRRLKGNGKNTTEKVFKEFFICIISRSSKYLKVLLVPICILLINIFAHESLHV